MHKGSDIPVSLMTSDGDTYDMGMEIIRVRPRRVIWLTVRDGRKVALKGLPEHLRFHPEEISSLRKEYLLGMKVETEGVARVYGFSLHPQVGYVIEMEYVDGPTLDEYLAGSKAGLQERRKLALSLATAIVAMHRAGVIHRDLKPDNILISSKDCQPKIIDFGNGDAEEFVIHKKSLGTELFGAPEQQIPSGGGKESDVYSFGKILEVLLPERRYGSLRNACLAQEPSSRPAMEHVARRLGRRVSGMWTIVAAVTAAAGVVAVIVLNLSTGRSEIAPESGAAADDTVATATVAPPEMIVEEVAVPEPVATKKESPRPVRDIGEIMKKYIIEADEINARYGAIPYDFDINDLDSKKENDRLRLQRGDEHFRLAEKMESELTSAGFDDRQRVEAKHELWTHIIMETNRIDGADDIRDNMMRDYGLQSGAE